MQFIVFHISPDETSKTVAFHAQASQQQYSDKDHILFDEEVFLNDGNAFNKYSGEFVVPVSGTYVLLASTSASRMQGATCDADLVVDGRAVARMLGRYSDGDTQVTGHAVLHLHQGQRVWVRSIGATAIDIRSLFSGFLLKADL
ncbi:uncharacterized protein LOC143298534 [Babylonia areolata]|uniref:uncharacterized protein LOC143298534 n=1 Tax=Babylonia areolata TaxID=304850 RepID=UPI003FD18E3E